MQAIINTKLILEDSYVWDGAVTFENGRIVQCGKRAEVDIPADAELIDAQGLYTAPGLVDIHNHGTVREHFYAAPRACADFFLSHGRDDGPADLLLQSDAAADAAGTGKRKDPPLRQGAGNLGGLYMEGPYMSGEGSNQNSILWRGEIRPEEYRPLIDAMRGFARIWAIDPARPGIERFMQDVRRADPNAIFALGHSHATAAQCRRVRGCGVKVQTHHGDSGKAPASRRGPSAPAATNIRCMIRICTRSSSATRRGSTSTRTC